MGGKLILLNILYTQPSLALVWKNNQNVSQTTAVNGTHTSILVASPPFTMGTVFPACILYGPIECPFRLRIGFTSIIGKI